MPRYFFDTRDGDQFVKDDVGLQLAGIEAARDAATSGLADLAKDFIPGSVRRSLSIEVRDEARRVLVKAGLWLEVEILG